jgi:hypothetical protein
MIPIRIGRWGSHLTELTQISRATPKRSVNLLFSRHAHASPNRTRRRAGAFLRGIAVPTSGTALLATRRTTQQATTDGPTHHRRRQQPSQTSNGRPVFCCSSELGPPATGLGVCGHTALQRYPRPPQDHSRTAPGYRSRPASRPSRTRARGSTTGRLDRSCYALSTRGSAAVELRAPGCQVALGKRPAKTRFTWVGTAQSAGLRDGPVWYGGWQPSGQASSLCLHTEPRATGKENINRFFNVLVRRSPLQAPPPGGLQPWTTTLSSYLAAASQVPPAV